MRYRAPRAAIKLSVGVLRSGRRETAYVSDISEGGMKIHGLRSPSPGELIRMHARGVLFDARICWVNGDSCGVQFCPSHSPADLRRFMATLPRLPGGVKKARPFLQEFGVTRGR